MAQLQSVDLGLHDRAHVPHEIGMPQYAVDAKHRSSHLLIAEALLCARDHRQGMIKLSNADHASYTSWMPNS